MTIYYQVISKTKTAEYAIWYNDDLKIFGIMPPDNKGVNSVINNELNGNHFVSIKKPKDPYGDVVKIEDKPLEWLGTYMPVRMQIEPNMKKVKDLATLAALLKK